MLYNQSLGEVPQGGKRTLETILLVEDTACHSTSKVHGISYTTYIAILCVGNIVYKGLLTTYVDWVDILSKFQPLRPTSHQNKHAIELFSLAHIEMKTKSKLPPNNMEAIPWTGEKQCRAKKRPPDIPEMFSPRKKH